MDTPCHSILIVDGEPAYAEALRCVLAEADPTWDIRVTGSLRGYREAVDAFPPDIGLLELNLPDGRAHEVLSLSADARPFPLILRRGRRPRSPSMLLSAKKRRCSRRYTTGSRIICRSSPVCSTFRRTQGGMNC